MSLIKFFSIKRVLTATIFIAITLAACILGGWLWLFFISILTIIGADEFINMLNQKEIYPSRKLIYIFIAIFMALGFCNAPEYFIHAMVFASIISFMRFLFNGGKQASSSDVFSTFFIIAYTGLLPAYFLLIRNLEFMADGIDKCCWDFLSPGAGFLFLTLMTIWTSDIGAYYTGKKYGKKPLCPSISPKKTVEGAIGGSVSGVLMAVIIGLLIPIHLGHSIILGLLIITTAQMGDLCESLIKRDVGVKDSGDIVPGHGGVLDRADSYVITAPIAFYYINYVILAGVLF